MPDLLLELRSEEIPARMQRKAAGDLKKLVTDALVEAGLSYEGAREYWTPRRLTLDIRGLTARSADIREERKGPRTDANEKAIEGFLRGAGLSSVTEAEIQTDPKKGEFYVAIVSRAGRPAEEIVAAAMPGIIRDFPWPKSMRWGAASAVPGSLRWVRPLQSIVCTFGSEHEETTVIPFEIDGLVAGNVTYGHRFHAPQPITVKRFDDYVASLERARVILDAERRKDIIASDAANLAFANGLDLVEDPALLEEVSGLVECPQVLMGSFEEDYLAIPAEIIRLTIKTNQKCFVTRPQGGHLPLDGGGRAESAGGGDHGLAGGHPTPDLRSDPPPQGEGALSNKFILVANIEASDGGREIVHGNGKVVRARLSDALHFWTRDQGDLPDLETLAASASKFDLDLKKPLDQRMAKLDALNVTFHAKLGTQGERVARIRALAADLAKITGADPALVDRAAVLAKADLRTEAVGEFPELQGLMGRKYAGLQGEHASVAAAIEDHWKPNGPSDRLPEDKVGLTIALADKLDTLVGFWAIDEKPTGSKDPFALRRAALGVVRILLERGIRIDLLSTIIAHMNRIDCDVAARIDADTARLGGDQVSTRGKTGNGLSRERDLLSFFHDRLKVYLRDQGARYDLIDAVLAAAPHLPLEGGGRAERAGGGDHGVAGDHPTPALRSDPPPQGEGVANDDLLMVARRVEALTAFVTSEDGRNLLAGTKRAVQLLAAEEKKGTVVAALVDAGLLTLDAEKELFATIVQASSQAADASAREDFRSAMKALSTLRAPVDRFFTDVLVNDDDAAVRANRLALLRMIREATGTVADFSRITG